MDQRRDLLGYILPKTVVGLALWLLIFALGIGASGVVFFVAYERRLTEMESRISSVRTELERKLNDAVTRLENADRANQGSVTGTGTAGPVIEVMRLLTSVGPSVAVVQGIDASGARTAGSGFVLSSTANQSWLLTGFHLLAGSVAASQAPATAAPPPPALPAPTSTGVPAMPTATPTVEPPPPPRVTVHLGGADRTGTVYTWDATHDLALLIVNVGSVPSLKLSDAVPAPGLSVWAVGAASGQFGATAAKGQLLGSSALSLTTDAVFGGTASGGPLVDREGKVMGVLGTFQATGTPISPAGQAVPVRLACLQVVVCPR